MQGGDYGSNTSAAASVETPYRASSGVGGASPSYR